MKGRGSPRENPYAPPAELSREPAKASGRNRLANFAFLLTLAPPMFAAFAPLAWLISPRVDAVIDALRWLLLLGSPAAVFAVALGIIAMQGRQSGYALAAMLLGGAECLLIIVGLMVSTL